MWIDYDITVQVDVSKRESFLLVKLFGLSRGHKNIKQRPTKSPNHKLRFYTLKQDWTRRVFLHEQNENKTCFVLVTRMFEHMASFFSCKVKCVTFRRFYDFEN